MNITVTGNNRIEDAVKNQVLKVHQKKAPSGKYVFRKGKRVKVVTITGTQTRVEQQYKDMLDVNRLLEPAMKKGLLRHAVKFEGEYDDIPVGDFQEAQFIVAKGRTMFEQLPSNMRLKFENDPAKFMKFVQDKKNIPWLKEQGILKGIDGLDSQGQRVADNPNTPEVEKPPESNTTEGNNPPVE